MKRTRRELRKAITESANGIKSNVNLKILLEISEIFRKSVDDKKYIELSDIQWKQKGAIIDIMEMENVKDVEHTRLFMNSIMRRRENKR